MPTRPFVVLLVVLLVLGSVSATAHYESTYFPLHVGNEWVYVDDQGLETIVTVDTSWASPTVGNSWFRLRDFNGDFHWARQTASGRVYEWPGRLWYRLGASPGTTWVMSINDDEVHGAISCSDGAVLQIASRDEPVAVPDGILSTIHIGFSSGCAKGLGITDEWFARGIGLVQRVVRTLTGTETLRLRRAVIGGRAICLRDCVPCPECQAPPPGELPPPVGR